MLSIALVLCHEFASETESWRTACGRLTLVRCIRMYSSADAAARIVASVEQEFEKSTVESCLSEVKGESRTG